MNASLQVLILVVEEAWQPFPYVISRFADNTNYGPVIDSAARVQQADTQLENAASNIASFQSNAPAGAGVDTVDLSAAVVALLSAKGSYAANVATVKAAEEIQGRGFDSIIFRSAGAGLPFARLSFLRAMPNRTDNHTLPTYPIKYRIRRSTDDQIPNPGFHSRAPQIRMQPQTLHQCDNSCS